MERTAHRYDSNGSSGRITSQSSKRRFQQSSTAAGTSSKAASRPSMVSPPRADRASHGQWSTTT
eukprot:7144279-Pyramimonas_sp.AAC.1